MPPSEPPIFLTIPFEIRSLIFQFLFAYRIFFWKPDLEYVWREVWDDTSYPKEYQIVSKRFLVKNKVTDMAICFVNKQCKAEAEAVLFECGIVKLAPPVDFDELHPLWHLPFERLRTLRIPIIAGSIPKSGLSAGIKWLAKLLEESTDIKEICIVLANPPEPPKKTSQFRSRRSQLQPVKTYEFGTREVIDAEFVKLDKVKYNALAVMVYKWWKKNKEEGRKVKLLCQMSWPTV